MNLSRTIPVAVLAAAAVAAPAAADHPGADEANLGTAHAAEHRAWKAQQQAELERWKKLTPAQRRAEDRSKARVRARAARAADPAEDGEWSQPYPHRAFGMHAVMLPTGKVLYWSLPTTGPFGATENEGWGWIWDPSKGTGPESMTDVDPPVVDTDEDGDIDGDDRSAPLYCSGQSLLPDGRVVALGGNKRWQSDGMFAGWEGVLTFNPWNETWTVQDDFMDHGRWYPTQVLTGDGRTLVMGGHDEVGTEAPNRQIDVFTPDEDIDGSGGDVRRLGTTERSFQLYPQLFTMPNGEILQAGPGLGETALFDPDTGRPHWDFVDSWWDRPFMKAGARIGGTAVLRADGPDGSDVVTNIGGMALDEPVKPYHATNTTETLDLTPSGGGLPTWEWDKPLNVARSNHNTVILPDGALLAVGGGRGLSAADGNRWNYLNGEARPVELLEPGAAGWHKGAAQAEDRGYHSIALLLPDGKVLSAGDDARWQDDTFEIYSPPYLFDANGPATRPVLTTVPQTIAYGEPFDISATGGATKAVLMAPGAVTHSTDMSQRHVELTVEAPKSGGLSLRAPANGNIAPPGYYMLFVFDAKGVPSEARWVQINGTWTPPPPPPPKDPDKPADPKPETPRQDPPRQDPPRQDPPKATETPKVPETPRPPRKKADRTVPKASMETLTARQLSTLRRTGRVTVSVKLGERARVEGLVRLHGGKRTVLARVARRWLERGTRKVTFRVASSKRATLRRSTVRLSVVVSDAAGNKRTLYTTLRRSSRSSKTPAL